MMVSLSLLRNEGIPLDLPPSQSAIQPDADAPALTLSVSREGRVFVEQVAVSLEELADRLAVAQRTAPDTRLILQGDAGADFGRIVEVLDVARQQGLPQVVIRTRPPESS
jgi:biopolymer transport protein ExbD